MPPDAAARSAVIADTMLPAPPVTQKTVSARSARSGSGSASRSTRPTDQRSSPAWPTSTTPGSRRVSSIRISASGGGLAARREVDGLDQRVGSLARERLDEAAHRPAHRGGRAGVVVAVPAAKACAGDQERPLALDLLGELAHRHGQPLHPETQALDPAAGSSSAGGGFDVEGGQPVGAVHGSVAAQPSI